MKRSRVRRSAEAAREAILDEAEQLLIERGPDGVKALAIAERLGVAHSNVLHHFGGIAGLHLALVERMLTTLAQEITALLADADPTPTAIDKAVSAVFHTLSQKGYARLIAWITLSADIIPMARMATPLGVFVATIETKLAPYLPARAAKAAARRIVHLIATTALGEGLVGPLLDQVLGGRSRTKADLRDVALSIVAAALTPRQSPATLLARLRQEAS